MTNRLPTPGGDDGDWGTILNGFLGVAHNADGTLNAGALSSAGATLSTNNLSDLADISSARSNLGLGTAATQASSAFDANGAAVTAQANAEAASLPIVGGTMTGPIVGLMDKGGQMFNVKAYGALGNGSNDDTNAIQSAITAACAVTGAVFFPPGVYLVSGLTFNAYCELVGSGISDESTNTGTRLILKNGANSYILTSNAAVNTFISIYVRHMMLDGNATNQTAVSGGINIIGPVACVFDHVAFYNSYDYAVKLNPLANASFGHHNRFLNCSFTHGSNGNGGGVQANNCDENSYEFCDWEFNSGYSIDDNAGLQLVTGGTFVQNSGTCVYQEPGKPNMRLNNVIFDSNTGVCAYINGNSGIIQNCTFSTSGSDDPVQVNEYYGQEVVQNNRFSANNSFATNYFINESPSGGGNHATLGNLITGNLFDTTNAVIGGMIKLNNPRTRTLNNPGWNPYTVSTPAFPTTTVMYTNQNGVDVYAYITNGTAAMTTQINGNAGPSIAASATALIFIPASGTFTATYASGSPSWVLQGN